MSLEKIKPTLAKINYYLIYLLKLFKELVVFILKKQLKSLGFAYSTEILTIEI